MNKPPSDLLAERGYLGKVLVRGIPEEASDITPQHFHDYLSRIVYEAALKIKQSHRDINVSTVWEYLEDNPYGYTQLDILNLLESETWTLTKSLESIRRHYRLRNLIDQAQTLLTTIYEESGTDDDLINQVEGMLKTSIGDTNDHLSVAEAEDLRIKELKNRATLKASGKEYIGDKTGFKFLDDLCDGIRGASYWVIAGASSSGKSAVMNNIMASLLAQDRKIALFTFEMIPEIYNTRLLSIMSGVSYDKIDKGYDFTGTITTEEEARVALESQKLRSQRLSYHTNANLSSLLKNLAMVKNSDYDYVCIDYLQNVDIDEGTKEYEAYKRLSKKLQQFAFQSKKTVILISQLSNDNIKNHDTQDSQAKGSGDVKNNSTHFVSISDYFEKKKREARIDEGLPRVIIIRLEKNQRGKTGRENYYYDGTYYNYKVADKFEIESYSPKSKMTEIYDSL